MKGDDRHPAFSRRLVGLVLPGLVVAALFFLLGWLAAGKGRLKPAARVATPALAPLHSPSEAPVSRARLARVAAELARRLSAVLPPEETVSERWEMVRDGDGAWNRVRLTGRYRDLKPFFRTGLEEFRQAHRPEGHFDCLAALDPVSRVFTLLLLSGRRVVLIAELAPLAPPPDAMEIGGGPQIAIIIDDMGRSLAVARELAAIDLPLTFAVFPHLPTSHRVAALLLRRSRDVMLHLPMEPRNWPQQDPGPGALYCRMDESEFLRVLEADLKAVPGIVGVNNHMGSRLTEDAAKMKLVMQALAGTGLFFIDSRTINDSVAGREAAAAGIPVLQRDVFLDNRPVEKAILDQFRVLIEVARSRGYAVGIGHPYPETVAALKKIGALAAGAGGEMVTVRKLVAARCDRPVMKPAGPNRDRTGQPEVEVRGPGDRG